MFANRWIGDDLDAEIEIAHHASHDGELLVVLLTEDGEVWSRRRAQLRHHRGDAVEVARTRRPLHRTGQPGNVDGRGEPVRVHRRCRGDVDHVDPELVAGTEIVVDRAWVAIEVTLLAELEGVDEHRHDDRICLPTGGVDELEMAQVQCPHRGDQRDRPARRPDI